MIFSSLSEDVRQLFIYSEALKDKVNSLGASTGAEQSVMRKAKLYIENIQAEVLSFNELLLVLTECVSDDDLKLLLDSYGDED